MFAVQGRVGRVAVRLSFRLLGVSWRRPQWPGHDRAPLLAPIVRGNTHDVSSVSVTGEVWSTPDGAPTVTLFTKFGCTLCDEVKGVLSECRATAPHGLQAVDITDDAHKAWWDKYKFDIPVLHVNGAYMAKHRITHADARAALAAAASGTFTPLKGEPDAARLEIVKPCKALR